MPGYKWAYVRSFPLQFRGHLWRYPRPMHRLERNQSDGLEGSRAQAETFACLSCGKVFGPMKQGLESRARTRRSQLQHCWRVWASFPSCSHLLTVRSFCIHTFHVLSGATRQTLRQVCEACASLSIRLFWEGNYTLDYKNKNTFIVPVKVPDFDFSIECRLHFVSPLRPVQGGLLQDKVCACHKNQTFSLCWNPSFGVSQWTQLRAYTWELIQGCRNMLNVSLLYKHFRELFLPPSVRE